MRAMLVHKKDYEVAGNKFTVQVQYQGYLPSGRLAQLKHTWIFAILVNGEIIDQGPWYDLQGRNPSNEEVCDGVASVFGDSKMIADAQELEGSVQFQLDEIVEKCAAWMHVFFLSEDREHTDYDIAMKAMDAESWVVILRPNYMSNRLVEFYKTTEMENVEVHSYIEDNELSVRF